MMREAQKMMNDPAFQQQMKQMMEQQNFQQAMASTKEKMADPTQLNEMERQAAAAIEEGNIALEEYEAARRKRITEQVALAKQKQLEEEEESKKSATVTDTTATINTNDEDDMVDMPVLNLN
jgi:hypothetical protein